jgi:hypothetical protein
VTDQLGNDWRLRYVLHVGLTEKKAIALSSFILLLHFLIS